MTKLKTLLYFALLLCVLGFSNYSFAQSYVKEDFESYGWWEGGAGKWTIGIAQAPFVPPATELNLTWGPNRARFYRESPSDPKLFSAFASRKLVGSDNYDSTFVPTVHSFMTRDFNYKKTTNPVYLEFQYLVNIFKTLLKTDRFYVALKKKSASDVPASWTEVFTYSNTVMAPGSDGISGTNSWFPKKLQLNTALDALLGSLSQDTLQLRFAFTGNTNPATISGLYNKAVGVWIDNVNLYEDIQYDLSVGSISLHGQLPTPEITDPAECENLFVKVVAGASGIPISASLPHTFNYTFEIYDTTVSGSNKWRVLNLKNKTHTQYGLTEADMTWNPLAGEVSERTSFISNKTQYDNKFRLTLSPVVSGTSEKDPNNNTKTKTYLVGSVSYEFTLDGTFNNVMYPEPASKKLKNLNPSITDAPAFWIEKYYDLTSTTGKTQVAVKVTPKNSFNLYTKYNYTIDKAYYIDKSSILKEITPLSTDIKTVDGYPKRVGDYIYFNFTLDPARFETKNYTYVYKLKLQVVSHDRGYPMIYPLWKEVCSSNTPCYALVPRDFQLVPEKTTELLTPPVDRMPHKLTVWRFNKHNKPVKFEFYTNIYYPAGTKLYPNYSVNLNNYENPAPPIDQIRPRTSLSNDIVYFGTSITDNLPALAPKDSLMIRMRGYDGEIYADSAFWFNVVKPAPASFELTVTNTPRTVEKPDTVNFYIKISRTAHTGEVSFNKTDVVVPANSNLEIVGFSTTTSGTFNATAGTTGDFMYMKVKANLNTPAGDYGLVVKGKSTIPVVMEKTANCTLKVSANWRALFRIREWNTVNPIQYFNFGMHINALENLDPANLWGTGDPYNEDINVSNPPAPPNFSWYFKFPAGTSPALYTKSEYRPIKEDTTQTTTYQVELRGRYPFVISYDPRQASLKNKQIVIKDKITAGLVYNQTIAYDATKTDVSLPDITNWAINDVWLLTITVKYKPTLLVGNPTDVTENTIKPTEFKLLQNYPNPFNPSTIISYSLQKDENVKLIVTNSIGEVVSTLVDGYQTAGAKAIVFNAKDLPSGIYFYKIQAGSFVETKKMMLVK